MHLTPRTPSRASAARGDASPAGWSATVRAPFAVLGVRTEADAVVALSYLPLAAPDFGPRERVAERAVRELERYLADPEFRFGVPLAPRGTPFQRRVWEAIGAIPRGESRTYLEVARTVGSAARPVGQACGANRIALMIPCHRVVGTRGALGGFMQAAEGEAIDIKRWLLTHEGYRFGLF